MLRTTQPILSVLAALLLLGTAGCALPLAHAKTRRAAPPHVASPGQIASATARLFMRQFASGRFDAQWMSLAPQARAQWPSPTARAAMLHTKFAGLRVTSIRLGSPTPGTRWQSGEDPRLHQDGVWSLPVSVSFAPSPRPVGVAALYRSLTVQISVSGGRGRVVNEGPASVDAPIVIPAHPVQRAVHVPILMYHLVAPFPSPSAWTTTYGYDIEYGLTVTPAQFAAQMHYLASHRYRALSLTRLTDSLLYGMSVPARSVVLTFDDGRASPWYGAVPLLRRLGMTAVFFPCAAFIGQTVQTSGHQNVQTYLTGDQIRALARGGFWIEDHGQKDQTVLWDASPGEIQNEAAASAAHLTLYSKQPVQFMAYTGALWPYPSASQIGPAQRVLFARLAALGYVGAVTDSRLATATLRTGDLWHLPRVRVHPDETLAQFASSLNS